MRRASYTLLFLIFAGLTNASAVVIDWSTVTWPAGSLSNSVDVDPGNPGNDATVTVSGDTAQLQPSLQSPYPSTPSITPALDGGFSPVHPSLELAINLASNAQGVTVTIDFSSLYALGVTNVSFTIFDIDSQNVSGSTYQDEIRNITATSTTGATIAPTITGLGSSVVLSGAGVNQVLTGIADNVDHGVGSNSGNATITFNTTDIRSITFTYGGGALFADPTYEHIALDNIDFSVVPEVNPAWFSLIFCAGLAAWTTARRRAQKGRVEARDV